MWHTVLCQLFSTEINIFTLCCVPGGLDETLNNIIEMCREQNVPLVFALGRRALGRACAKLVPVSVVGIFSYEGSEVKSLSPERIFQCDGIHLV